jgi:photosystem II stability/assembly factor-like uncharacterized protein
MKKVYFFTLILFALNYSLFAQPIFDKEFITTKVLSELKTWSVTELAKGGRIDALRVFNDSIVVCGVRGVNKGNLYISYDYGNTWKFLAKPCSSEITCIAETGDINTFYILTGEAEVYGTKDLGRTWKKLASLTVNKNRDGATASYSVICTSKGTLLVSDTDSDGGHIFRSINKGKTWTDLGAIGKNALYRFEKAGDAIIVNGFEGSVYKSSNDGLTWNKGYKLGKSALFATEYLGGTKFLQADQAGNIYHSLNMGESWQKSDSLNGSADDYIFLKDGIVLYSTYTGNQDVYMSLNYGENWLSIGNVPTNVKGDWLDHGICFETKDSLIVLAGTGMGFILRNAVSKKWLSDMTAALDPKELKKKESVAQTETEVSFRNPRVPGTGSKNLIPNSSFELGTDGWSSIGKTTGWGGDLCSLFGEIDPAMARDGKNSLRIDLGPGKTEITYFDVWPMARVAQTAPRLANRGWIDAVPGQKYTLSAFLRADRNGIPAQMTVYQAADPSIQTRIDSVNHYFNLTNTWIRYSFTITASEKQVFVAVGPNLSNENDSASVWIDAIQFEKGVSATGYSSYSPVEIGLSSGKFGNIFKTGEPVNINFTCINKLPGKVIIPVQCDVTDYFDMKVLHTEKQISVSAGGIFDIDWPLQLPGTGHYNVRFSWNCNNQDYSRSFPLALIDPYLWENSHFGINHSPATASASYAIQEAGLKWDRNWSINWGMLEPEEGNLSFIEADKQILNAEKLGYKIVSLLPPLPSANWGSTAPDSVPANLWYRMSYMPTDVNKLMNFISSSIEHYKDKLKYWEFLNEPIWTRFTLPAYYYGLPGSDYIPSDYIALLKKAYPVMKKADSSCIVIGGFSAEPWRFTKEFIQSDGLKYIDILNVHNYGGFTPPEAFIPEMDTLLSQMDRYGVRKPIWITEYSYYGVDIMPWTPWKATTEGWGSNLLLKDERQCADWTIRYNTMMFAHGVEMIIYHMPSDGLINDGSSSIEFALLGEEGVPKKLYAAQAAQAKLLGPHFKYAGQLEMESHYENSLNHQILAYSFQCEQRAVVVAWISENKTSTVKLIVPEGVDVFNIMGTKLAFSGEIELSNSPVYIVSDSMTALDLLKSCSLKKNEMDVVAVDDKQNLSVQ